MADGASVASDGRHWNGGRLAGAGEVSRGLRGRAGAVGEHHRDIPGGDCLRRARRYVSAVDDCAAGESSGTEGHSGAWHLLRWKHDSGGPGSGSGPHVADAAVAGAILGELRTAAERFASNV